MVGGWRSKLTPEQWAQAGRLIAAGESRQRVAMELSTLYKKFPANSPQKKAICREVEC